MSNNITKHILISEGAVPGMSVIPRYFYWKCERCFGSWFSLTYYSLEEVYKWLEETGKDDCDENIMREALE